MATKQKSTSCPDPSAKELYVVYWCESLRDGVDEGARIVASLEAARELLDKLANGFAGRSLSFKLFKLGEEISLSVEEIDIPQPSVRSRRIRIGR